MRLDVYVWDCCQKLLISVLLNMGLQCPPTVQRGCYSTSIQPSMITWLLSIILPMSDNKVSGYSANISQCNSVWFVCVFVGVCVCVS